MEFEPGRRLSESELGDLFNVSRTPIREAIAQLREDGLVEIVPQYGTFVALISRQAIADAQFVREALECEAVRFAAERANDDGIAALKKLIREQEQAARAGDHDRFYALDHAFHRTLFELSGHNLWSVVERADGHLDRLRRANLPRPRYLKEVVSQHKEVCEALRLADPVAAETALRTHLHGLVVRLDELRDAHPEYFAQT
jgi:DNA-binding GntR family transcriptional regulator